MLWVSRNVVLWLKHFDVRVLVPMFDLKFCSRIHIYMYMYIKMKKKNDETTVTTTMVTVFLVPRGVEQTVVPAMRVDTLRGGRKGEPQH